jgi:DNA-binding transcriptional LysR family regulator
VELTPAGAMFYKQARRILRDLDITFESARGTVAGQLGKLRLGVGIATIHSLIPRALLKFRETCPGIEIEIADMSTVSQIEALIAGRLDVGFVRLPAKHPQVAVRRVLSERLAIAVSDRLKGVVAMVRIREQPFIIINRGVSATYHDHCISLCNRSGFAPRIVYEANDMFTILNLVSVGIGVSLVPSSARAMHVTGVNLFPSPTVMRNGTLEWRGTRNLSLKPSGSLWKFACLERATSFSWPGRQCELCRRKCGHRECE